MTQESKTLRVVVLAAGEGKRMKSAMIKVLHSAGGRPLIDYVLDLASRLSTGPAVLVVGHHREAVIAHCEGRAAFVVQQEQLGTGHAVLQSASLLENQAGDILVLSGDVPLTRAGTLQSLVEEHRRSKNTVMVHLANAMTALRRRLRDDPATRG